MLQVTKTVQFGFPFRVAPVSENIYFRACEDFTYGSRISNFAKPASNWFKKKLARGKSWQNSHDEL